MKKIVYLHQYFNLPENNGGTRSYDLAKKFIEQGSQVDMVTSSAFLKISNGNRWEIIEREGIRVHILSSEYDNSMSYFRRVLAFLHFLWFSTLKLLELKGDIVLATSTPLTIGIPALIKKWLHKTPFVFEVRDVWPEAVIAIGAVKNKILKKLLFFLEKLIYKNASAIIALSTDMKNSIIKRVPKFERKVSVIENISEIDRFSTGLDSANSLINDIIGYKPRFTILYAGTFGKVNGIEYVIQFAKKLIKYDSSIAFLLIGSGAEKEGIISLASELDVLNRNVFISEPVAKNKLPQLYYEADMGSSFVIPVKELWANSANKFFDSLAAGTPILINYAGWQSDVLTVNNLGFVLNPSIEEMSKENSILEFINYSNNARLLKEQGVNAKKIAEVNYSLEVAAEKYKKVLSEV